jgi:hypothetical protein
MRTIEAVALLSLISISLAGCVGEETAGDSDLGATEETGGTIPATTAAEYATFTMPAVHQGHGLYEPTIDVSNTGVIYVSAHSTGIGQAPAPAYFSKDDGVTWKNLPVTDQGETPDNSQGGTPPASDEIFIVAGTDGSAWGVDINLHNFLITGWCGEASTMCYHNPSAYDHAKTGEQATECTPTPLKDRPWAAYASGKLFIVNNPGAGPAQIAIMDVPTTETLEAGPEGSNIQWNLCASSGGFIPGIPDMRDDLLFAVPQQQGSNADTHYTVAIGNGADIMTTNEYFVFDNTNVAPAESDSTVSEIGEYGQASFDASGDLWVGAMNNAADEGGFQIALSQDDGQTFSTSKFRFPTGVSSIYMDGNKAGAGALINWGVIDGDNTDWYMGHLTMAADGTPALTNVMLAFDDGPEASRHVQGAALGPDGRAYMVMSDVSGNDDAAMAAAVGTTPMRVVVQQSGPILE